MILCVILQNSGELLVLLTSVGVSDNPFNLDLCQTADTKLFHVVYFILCLVPCLYMYIPRFLRKGIVAMLRNETMSLTTLKITKPAILFRKQ